MEPTTIILLAALMSPAVPTKVQAIARQDRGYLMPAHDRAPTATPSEFSLSGMAVTARSIVSVAAISTTPLQAAINTVKDFNAQGSVDAVAFLQKLPSGFPIPHILKAEDGLIGLFWETGTFYADIEFSGDGLMSVFTRTRGDSVQDRGIDDVRVDQPFSAWGYEYLTQLMTRASSLAA